MNKKKLIIGIAAGAALVALAIILPLTLGKKGPDPAAERSSQSSASAQTPTPAAPPESSSTPAAPPVSKSDSIPYVGPVDKAIVGKWERHFEQTAPDDPSSSVDPTKPVWVTKYEFTADGTFLITVYDVLDEEYPENWEYAMYNYTFDTYRDEDVMYCEFFTSDIFWSSSNKPKPLYYKFYTWEDGRDAMDIWRQKRDGSVVTFSEYTFLRLEE